MRLDKFLKVSRIIKRRTLAKEVCDQGRVLLNGSVAKASSTVKVGDRLTIRFGQKEVTFEITQLLENPRKDEAQTLYKILEEKRIETEDPTEDLPLW